MNNFCVLHITKYKGDLGRIGAHIDRLHVPHNANEKKVGFNEEMYLDDKQELTIRLKDILGTKINWKKSTSPLEKYTLDKGAQDLTLQEAVNRRIKEGHTIISKRTGKVETIRKDAVTAVGIVLTGSPERMYEIEKDPELFDRWKRANFEFMAKKFGKENIVRFVLHIDEKTPHLHCVVVPITPEGRLSASYFLDWTLKEFQDGYALAMKPFGFVRGISKLYTQKEHKETLEFYQEQNLENSKIRAQVETDPNIEAIKTSNVFCGWGRG